MMMHGTPPLCYGLAITPRHTKHHSWYGKTNAVVVGDDTCPESRRRIIDHVIDPLTDLSDIDLSDQIGLQIGLRPSSGSQTQACLRLIIPGVRVW